MIIFDIINYIIIFYNDIGKSSLIKYASPSFVQLITIVIISIQASKAFKNASLYSGSITDGWNLFTSVL